MAESATILIPDISGFTTFVARTELEHSAHIVTELLDAIAEANTTGLTLSEIEGDALLLYRKGPAPSVGEVVDQCIEMFVRFHECLATIERYSVCPCGACQTASGLGVKFIVHFGEIQEITVAGFTKATGLDMIIAHKLLKAELSVREHILITEAGAEGLGAPEGSGRLSWKIETRSASGRWVQAEPRSCYRFTGPGPTISPATSRRESWTSSGRRPSSSSSSASLRSSRVNRPTGPEAGLKTGRADSLDGSLNGQCRPL